MNIRAEHFTRSINSNYIAYISYEPRLQRYFISWNISVSRLPFLTFSSPPTSHAVSHSRNFFLNCAFDEFTLGETFCFILGVFPEWKKKARIRCTVINYQSSFFSSKCLLPRWKGRKRVFIFYFSLFKFLASRTWWNCVCRVNRKIKFSL